MRLHNYLFTPKLAPSLITLISLMLLCSLGGWQLSRAKQKQQILFQSQKQLAAKPLENIGLETVNEPMQFHPIQITGIYDNNHSLLLDNRFYNHQVGYEVLTPFQVDDSIILVNRGWIPRPLSRAQLPKLDQIIGHQSLSGTIYFPPHNSFILSHKKTADDTWPNIIQKIDFEQIQTLLNYPVLPFIIRLDEQDPNSYVRDWKIITLSPAQHIAYAVQWFALAGILLITYLTLSIQRAKNP